MLLEVRSGGQPALLLIRLEFALVRRSFQALEPAESSLTVSEPEFRGGSPPEQLEGERVVPEACGGFLQDSGEVARFEEDGRALSRAQDGVV